MLEIERKYVIKKPNTDALTAADSYTVSDILQIYLEGSDGVTRRIRRRIYGDRTVYTETEKLRIDKMSVIERERDISEGEFSLLCENVKNGTRPINKRRHTFVYKGEIFEIDEYPEWERTAILETELDSRDKEIEFPPFIETVREVTGDFNFSNAGMAREFPKEII